MNPLAIEQQFQSLQQTLPLVASRRNRLHLLSAFLDPLLTSEKRTLARAYAPECVSLIMQEIPQTSFAGVRPSFLQQLARIITNSRSAYASVAEIEEWEEAERVLLKEETALRDLAQLKTHEQKTTGIRDVDPGIDVPHPGIAIPVVEEELLLQEIEPMFAVIRHVRVEVHFTRRTTGEDEILIDQAFDPDGVQHRQLRLAVANARSLVRSFGATNEERRIIVHCTFDEPNIIIGESLGVGLTFAVFVELLRLLRHREEVALRRDVAITGVVDSNGEVLPVDLNGLRLKIAACAYSPIQTLVLPRSQEEAAHAILQDIAAHETIPPALTIIGVSKLEELLYDRRISIVTRISIGRHIVGIAKQHQLSLGLAFSVLLLSWIFQVWIGPFDKNPVSAEYRQESLILQNKSGEQLARLPVGSEIVVEDNRSLLLRKNTRFVALSDVNGDGSNEVLYVRQIPGEEGWSELRCESVEEGDTLWTYRLSRTHAFGPHARPMEYLFRMRGFIVQDVDKNGDSEVIGIASAKGFYASMIFALHARDGIQRGEYVHVGMLTDVAVVDIDDDSTDEVMTCGINNAFRSAVMAAFEYPNISGSSPSTPDYAPRSMPPGSEEYYVLLPRTIVGDAFRSKDFGNMAMRLGTVRKNQIVVELKDFEGYMYELGQTIEGSIAMTFGKGFEIIRVEPNEPYTLTSEILFHKQRIDRLPDDRYYSDYVELIRFWNESAWQAGVSRAHPSFRRP